MSAKQGVEGGGRGGPENDGTVAEPYSVEEAMPFVLFLLLIAIMATLVVVIGWRVGDLTTPADMSPRDVELLGTVDLRGESVEPYRPFGPHAHAINLTMDVGDVLSVEFTSLNAQVQVFVQRPLHPLNSTTLPAVVLATSSGTSGLITFEAVEPGAVQVYVVNPAALQPPPAGMPASEWHIAARVSYTVRVDRAP